ncbi:hypothetical protein [Enterococcus rivorum]|uniref:hypothetical protein n=1 Tax=Enterococcus rivorum TaxID=762845 RepID=UPI0036411296
MKASVEASAVVARALSRMNPVANILDSLLNIQKNLNQMAESLEEDIRELEDKLEKLREFSAETSGLFTNSLSDMKLAMQGILVLNNTIVNKDGTYQLPVGTDIHWFKQLKQSELDRIIGKERPPNVGNREYKLIDLGYGKIWCWVEKGKNVATAEDVRVTLAYNEWLSRMVDKYGLSFIQGERPKGIDELFYEQNATLIKELATGIDSVTGKKLSTVEKLEKASLLANGMITIGVMVKGVLNVGKTQNPKSVKPNKKASGADTTAKDLSQFEKLKGEYASKEIPNADRIGSGLKDDPSHRAASFITEEQLAKGRVTSFTGSDNKSYSMLQTKGNLNGLDGIYEYI